MKNAIFLFLLVLNAISIKAQKFEKLNFALSSHPMRINKIEILENNTKVDLAIENQIETGSFCADKNIDLKDVISGKSYHLLTSFGIPVCPDSYKFKFAGEILNFSLYFPKITEKVKFLDIIENCDQYCFSIRGIILDEDMNKDIDLGYDYYTKGKLDFALQAFKMAVENNKDYPYGFLYMNIIQILIEKNDISGAKGWYSKLLSSQFLDRNEVIQRIKKQSYYSKLI
ncbi:MAG: hypothetical protein U0W24_11855 [Bacteroidales bacterium]